MTALPASFAPRSTNQDMQQATLMDQDDQTDLTDYSGGDQDQGRSMFGRKSFKQAYDAAAKTARSASQATQAAARSAADAIQPAVASLVAAGQSAGTLVQNGVHNLSSRSHKSSAPAQQGLLYCQDHSAMKDVEEEGSALEASPPQQAPASNLLQVAAGLGSRAIDTSSAAIIAAVAGIKRMAGSTSPRHILPVTTEQPEPKIEAVVIL